MGRQYVVEVTEMHCGEIILDETQLEYLGLCLHEPPEPAALAAYAVDAVRWRYAEITFSGWDTIERVRYERQRRGNTHPPADPTATLSDTWTVIDGDGQPRQYVTATTSAHAVRSADPTGCQHLILRRLEHAEDQGY